MTLLEDLRSGLVVSCQPVDGGAMDHPFIVAAMAKAAITGGAKGVRIEGVENVKAVREVITQPIIGIVKEDLSDSPVRITPRIEQAERLAESGADIIAYDATDRSRADSRERVLGAILSAGRLAMADCSTFKDAQMAVANGATILGTTLSGYTADTLGKGPEPDFGLIRDFSRLGGFVMAEGRFNSPELAARALKEGADSVTVGSALTRLELMVDAFCSEMAGRNS